MKFIAKLRGLLFLGLVFGIVVVVGFWVISASAIFHRPAFMRILCSRYSRFSFRLFGVKVIREGMEHLDPDKRYLFVSNHQSFLDIMTMMGWLRFPAFLAKAEIQKWPLFGWSMRQLGCVFVDRRNRRDRLNTPVRVRQALEMGNDFCIFPEGTRTPDGHLQDFQAGAFHIATEAKLTIVPIAIDGTWQVLNKRGVWMYPGTVRLGILDPIDLSKEPCDHRELSGRVHAAIQDQLSRWRVGDRTPVV